MDLFAGGYLQSYRLERQIGSGGMSVVWAATDTRDGRRVALKLLRSTTELDTARVRFLREAHASQRLTHRAIVPVVDTFSHAENPVLVMELLQGETFRALLTREPALTLTRTAEILLPICEALHEAHLAGIVHRDLKPENIFIEAPSGATRLLDFGVARSVDPGGASAEEAPITALGSLVGTIAYMAPEQAMRPSDSDARVDVWALGVTLYEALSGCRPIEGETPQETMRQLLVGGITPLAVVQPGLPRVITDLVDSMLTRRLERRLSNLDIVTEVLRSRLE